MRRNIELRDPNPIQKKNPFDSIAKPRALSTTEVADLREPLKRNEVQLKLSTFYKVGHLNFFPFIISF